MTITVLLVDDQPLIRMGFRGLIASDAEFQVVGEAAEGQEAVAQTVALRPDVVLMDVRMPGMGGLEATRLICSHPELSDTKVLILTTFEHDKYVLQALRAGASGFLGKTVEPVDLLAAIRVVAGGESLLSPRATTSLIQRFLDPVGEQHSEVFAELTDREREVLVLVASGQSNAEIAAALVISPLTAKTHVNRTMTKLGVRDRSQLVILAYQHGLVRP